jgi:hypothetical protein
MSDADSSATDGAAPTDAEIACFEAGIKFGSLYHQFAGTPVSPDSAGSVATAMEEAIENQPHCEEVVVAVDETELRAELAEGPADYTELTGRFLDVDIHIDYEGRRVHAQMRMEDGYPLMEVVAVE